MPQVLRKSVRKAIKAHRCNFCQNKIESGTKYNYSFLIYCGDAYDFKSHIHCGLIATKLNMYKGCEDEGLSTDIFCEFISETYSAIQENTNTETYDWKTDKTHWDYKLKCVCETHDIELV